MKIEEEVAKYKNKLTCWHVSYLCVRMDCNQHLCHLCHIRLFLRGPFCMYKKIEEKNLDSSIHTLEN